MKRLRIFAVVALAASLAGLGPAAAAPELTDSQRQQVLASIASYVEQDEAIKGSFLLLDPRTSQPLALRFDHVHQAVEPDGDGYLACVDFKDSAGKVYDVDVVVALEGGATRVEQVRLHKADGVAVEAKPQ